MDYNPTRLLIFGPSGEFRSEYNLLRINPGFESYRNFQCLGNGQFIALSSRQGEPARCVRISLDPFQETVLHEFEYCPLEVVDRNRGTGVFVLTQCSQCGMI